MEEVKVSFPVTVGKVEYGVDREGNPTDSTIATMSLQGTTEGFINYYGKDNVFKMTVDTTEYSVLSEGETAYLNEVGYMFSTADEKIIEQDGRVPLLHKQSMLMIIDDIKAELEDDGVKAITYTNLTKKPLYKEEYSKRVVGKSYVMRPLQNPVEKPQDPTDPQ